MRIYDCFPAPLRRQRIYRGLYGAAAYQSVYGGGGYGVDLAHQIGVPASVLGLATAPLAALTLWLALPAIVAAMFLLSLAMVDVARTRPPRTAGRALRFRIGVAAMTMLQPIARTWGRLRHREVARRDLPPAANIPGPATPLPGGVLLFADEGDRAGLAAQIVGVLRRHGYRVLAASGWEDYDARVVGSLLVHGELVTSAHPIGSVQMRVRRRFRRGPALVVAAAVCLLSLASIWVGAVAVVAAGATVARASAHRRGGAARRDRRVRDVMTSATAVEQSAHDARPVEGRLGEGARRPRVPVVVGFDLSQRVGRFRRSAEAQQAGAVDEHAARPGVLHDCRPTAREVADRAVTDPRVLQVHARRLRTRELAARSTDVVAVARRCFQRTGVVQPPTAAFEQYPLVFVAVGKAGRELERYSGQPGHIEGLEERRAFVVLVLLAVEAHPAVFPPVRDGRERVAWGGPATGHDGRCTGGGV